MISGSGFDIDVEKLLKEQSKNRAFERNKRKIELYFKTLGYRVDFVKDSSKIWWELYKHNKLVAQIDFGIPLDHIIEDMCCWAEKKEATSSSNYEVRGNGTIFEELLENVYTKEHSELKVFFFHNNSYGNHYTVMALNKRKAHESLLNHFKYLRDREGNLIGEIETCEELLEEWKDINNLPKGYVIDVYYQNHVLQGCNS